MLKVQASAIYIGHCFENSRTKKNLAKKDDLSKPKLGTVSSVKKFLEREHKDSTGSNDSTDDVPSTSGRKIGKVDTSFLEQAINNNDSVDNKRPVVLDDPVMSKVNAAKVGRLSIQDCNLSWTCPTACNTHGGQHMLFLKKHVI